MHPRVRYRIRQALSKLGLRAAVGERCDFSLQSYLALLKRNLFIPPVTIDVGAADGTFEIYDAFPQSFHLLIEPVPQFAAHLQTVLRRYRGAVVSVAAGASNGTASLHIKDDLHASHISSMHDNESTDNVVTLRRVDSILEEMGLLQGPFLLKVDTQGAELDVIRGSFGILDRTEAVILETSLFRFDEDMPLFHEVIAFMGELGFLPHAIFGGYGRPFDGALAQIDVAFVKEAGIFRKTDMFMTPEQAAAHRMRLLPTLKRLVDSR